MKPSDLNESVQMLPICRWKGGACTCTEDAVVEEVFRRIFVNETIHGSLDCSPWEVEELALGYLYTEGMFTCREEVESVIVREGAVFVQLREIGSEKSPPPICGAPLSLSPRTVTNLICQLEEHSQLFRHTGGVHTAALSDGETVLAACEDVGRRNALDRLIGHCLIHDIPMAGRVILFSGRVPEEIVRKVACVGCSALLSVSAPTSLGVRAAEEEGILLAGFVRGDRFNVYTFPERIRDVSGEN